ncbi:tyrosine-type recombinase/integrase [Coprobacillus cateniformis]|uniref:tyrosine-type recombinase/integrase n=1 Tax=Bacillati TaxID=1783272 RepID=UPI0039A02284
MKSPKGFGSVSKLSGNRRKPYVVRVVSGYDIDPKKETVKTKMVIIGYAATRREGKMILADYHNNPYDLDSAQITFKEVYERYSLEKYGTITPGQKNSYHAAYITAESLHSKAFRDLKTADYQRLIDTCGKHYPSLKRLKYLFSQMYKYALKNDICNKDYSPFIDITKYKDVNPNAYNRKNFTTEDIEELWKRSDEPYYQVVLILIYTGLRIGELLNLKKETVHLDEQWFEVTESKTINGIRRVPIADKVLPFFKSWYESTDECEYLIHSPSNEQFSYRNYYDSYFMPLMKRLDMTQTPHCCRHTCVSLLATAEVNQTVIKKIVGHSGAMSLTEKVYTHFDMQVLIDAINKI